MMTRKNFQEYLIKDNAVVARAQAIFRGRLARLRYLKSEKAREVAKERGSTVETGESEKSGEGGKSKNI